MSDALLVEIIYFFYHILFNNIPEIFYETEVEPIRFWTFTTLTIPKGLINFLFRKSSCEFNIIISLKVEDAILFGVISSQKFQSIYYLTTDSEF